MNNPLILQLSVFFFESTLQGCKNAQKVAHNIFIIGCKLSTVCETQMVLKNVNI